MFIRRPIHKTALSIEKAESLQGPGGMVTAQGFQRDQTYQWALHNKHDFQLVSIITSSPNQNKTQQLCSFIRKSNGVPTTGLHVWLRPFLDGY